MSGNQLNRIQINRENKIKSLLFLFFKKIHKINKPLEKLTKREREANYYYKNKKGDLTKSLQILNRKQKNIIKLYANTFLKHISFKEKEIENYNSTNC